MRRYSRKNIFGLEDILNSKIATKNIAKTYEDVKSLNNTETVASTKSVLELRDDLKQQIKDIDTKVNGSIDDSVESASDKTWSVDKIKEFVASVDDSKVVETIEDRDALEKHESLIVYVLDTTGDKSLGDKEGLPYSYVYTNNNWRTLAPVSQEIDTSVFVRKTDVVNDLETVKTDAPLSAAMGKRIKEVEIPAAIAQNSTSLATEDLVVKDNKITLSATPLGAIVMNRVEVSTEEGVVIYDASVTGTKEVTIENNNEDIEGKLARVSYLMKINEGNTSNSTSETSTTTEEQTKTENVDNTNNTTEEQPAEDTSTDGETIDSASNTTEEQPAEDTSTDGETIS